MGKRLSRRHDRRYSNSSDVWLTPREIIDELGPFDLDPCAADPRPFDIGRVNYTEKEDGLSKIWGGFVFANPPYGSRVGPWLERMAAHGDGIALVFARTDTKAMQAALASASAVFFLAGRLQFLGGKPPHGAARDAGAPSVLIGWGDEAVSRLFDFSNKRSGILYVGNVAVFTKEAA